MAAELGQTTSRLLNRLAYDMANKAADVTTAATGDYFVVADVSDDYEIKFADGANLWEAIGSTATVTELNTSVAGLLATTAEINRVADVSTRLVAAGGTLSVTTASHDGKTILLDTAAGSVCTLPAATGSGARFRFVISVIATSNSHKIQCVGDDIMQGFCHVAQDGGDTSVTFETAADSDTITLNRTTTGSTQIGEWFELEDIKADTWAVRGQIAATGTEATPFSAAVS